MAEQLTGSRIGGVAGDIGLGRDGSGGWGGEGGDGSEQAPALDSGQLGLWAFLGTLTMLFAGFTSAYLVRRAGTDWRLISMPAVLWFNTALLLSSSVTLEIARVSMRRWRTRALKGWLLTTTLLGCLFLAGQLLAWQQLAAQGVYLPSSPHSSFFYMLTAVHGVHLLAGVLALLYAFNRVWRLRWTPSEPGAFHQCATYWHFVDGAWLYLFFLLFAW